MQFSYPLLIGDIGGTNTRLARVEAPGDDPGAPILLPSSLDAFEATLARERVRSVLLGAAGPATGRGVRLTNTDFTIDGSRLAGWFGLAQGLVVNDFEAEALSLAAMGPDDSIALAQGVEAAGPRLILGPGTGIGVGALIDVGGRYLPLGTEAGHVGFAPESVEEEAILSALRRREGRICAESLLCGPGLARLHGARLQLAGGAEAPSNSRGLLAAAKADPASAAAATLRLFWRMLGAFAGDMALVFRATGGVWLTGDLARASAPLCDAAAFRAAFIDKPPYQDFLAAMPLCLVARPHLALKGLARLAAQPGAYLIDYGARLWRP